MVFSSKYEIFYSGVQYLISNMRVLKEFATRNNDYSRVLTDRDHKQSI